MSGARQSVLTDHFSIKKKTPLGKSQKDRAAFARRQKAYLRKKILNSVPLQSPETSQNVSKRRKPEESESPEQILEKQKVQPKGMIPKISKDKRLEIKDKYAALPSKEILIEEVKKLPASTTTAESSNTKPTPAFERFHHLLVKTVTLALPFKYMLLETMFVSMDRTVSMLYNRQELCTFSKIKVSVQEMIKRTFDLLRLGQIAKVYPDAYKFVQEKIKAFVFGNESPYQLVIYPILKTLQKESNECNKLNSALLIERKNQFQTRILDIVKDHHEIFLRNLEPPVIVEKEKLTNWHPQFKLDQVPDVASAELPQPPNASSSSSAKDVLEEVRGLHDKRIETALQNVMKKFHQASPTLPETTPNKNAEKLKKIPPSLVEKVRAKESLKIQMELTVPPQECLRRTMLAKLPEIVQIIRMYFVIEKKAVILMENVILKTQESLKTGLSYAEIEDHIQLLAELVPNWLILITVKKSVYVKVKKDVDLNVVIDKLKNAK